MTHTNTIRENMKVPATNRSLFNQSSTTILKRGLHTMTLACEALVIQNSALNDQIDALTKDILKADSDTLM
jgi:hypothetical protein|tara:strand:+ start:6225 stop:6437 length:213 start_codon:yes stop_codon:yes gene_type:complete